MSFDAREVLEDRALQGDREAPIQLASRECAEQLDKLTAMVAMVEDRLQAVRHPDPQDERAEASDEPALSGSRLAIDLRSYADKVKYLQRRLRVLLEELEL